MENIAKSTFDIFNERNELLVIKLENDTDQREVISKHCVHEFVHLYICLRGSVSVEIVEQHYSFPLKEDTSTLIYIRNFMPQLNFNLEPGAQVIGIYITVDRLHSLFSQDTIQQPVFDNIKLGKRIVESTHTRADVYEVAHQLFEKNLSETYQSIYVKGKVLELLGTYFYTTENGDVEQCPYIANEESAAKIKSAKNIIIKDLSEAPTINDLAKMVGLNAKALKEGFKELYGKPVFTYLFHYRMEEARRMLEAGTHNVSEVAPLVGYSSASHFITAFKRKYGMTPKQFLR